MARKSTKRLQQLSGTSSPDHASASRPSAPSRSSGSSGSDRPGFDDDLAVSWANFVMISAIVVVALLVAGVFFGVQRIESNLETTAANVLENSGFGMVEAVASGADLSITGTYYEDESRDAVVATVAAIQGVRSVQSHQLYPIERPREAEVIAPQADAINVFWGENTVRISGDVSDTSNRTQFVTTVQEAAGQREVLAAELVTVEGIPSEAEWIDEMAALVALAIPGIPEGAFFVNPSGEIFQIGGETESRQLAKDINQAAEEIAVAFGFAYTDGVIVPEPELTIAEVVELQVNLDELIEGKVVEFETASADLTEVGQELLDEISEAIDMFPKVPIRIEGHADAEGSQAKNLSLSILRAEAVREYLVAKGADPNRFTVEGFGDTRPIADNDTEEGRARNRRIEFIAELE